MRRALAVARQAGDDIPVGAVVVGDGGVISVAHNEREATGDPTGHVEVLALRRAAEARGTWR
ncbi:MAG: deaminase, partial [Streptosporangiaceae bacterium]